MVFGNRFSYIEMWDLLPEYVVLQDRWSLVAVISKTGETVLLQDIKNIQVFILNMIIHVGITGLSCNLSLPQKKVYSFIPCYYQFSICHYLHF